ncbi:MAG: hypothetical protein AAGD32_17360 [Planctomycetota bacterium]
MIRKPPHPVLAKRRDDPAVPTWTVAVIGGRLHGQLLRVPRSANRGMLVGVVYRLRDFDPTHDGLDPIRHMMYELREDGHWWIESDRLVHERVD